MKKTITLLQMFILLFSLIHSAPALAEPVKKTQNTYYFPSSLQVIESEAFFGTAAANIIFPPGIVEIESNAFGNSKALQNIFIPSPLTVISNTAFPVKQELVIHGLAGSTAQNWAALHKIMFIPDGGRNGPEINRKGKCEVSTQSIWVNNDLFAQKEYQSEKRTENKDRSMRPQDRPELNPIDYKFP